MAEYASVIIDISHEQLDRMFQYRIPAVLEEKIKIGMPVLVPFGNGNRMRKAYVVELSDKAQWEEEKIKEIIGVAEKELAVEDQLVELAAWIKEQYGSTMIQALKTVMPVKEKVKTRESRYYQIGDEKIFLEALKEAKRKKNYQARARFLELLLEQGRISDEGLQQNQISLSTIKPLVEKGIVVVDSGIDYRLPSLVANNNTSNDLERVVLNEEQQAIVCDLIQKMREERHATALIHGITGSGKTEVYMELIAHVIKQKKQAIVLIPEIALTYQTVMRFYKRFGNRVSLVNSRLSAGEKFDQFQRAKKGLIDVMIGPRSALFTPFQNLGLIIIDEEHENAYKSETMPRYHARETAIKRGELSGAMVVLGSATPSMEAYYKAKKGDYFLYQLTKRAVTNSNLANVHVVDLREEMRLGNKTIFSALLQEKIEQCLEKKEQILLFLNRRGYAGFVSCRSCGEPVHCPHCDVSLTMHNNGTLMCHYCGYTIPIPKQCPSCSSPYIAGFGLGTQKVQAMVEKRFPGVRTLRMDMDTTSGKDGHQEILSAFAKGEADILIGTQMIVKGHDFPNVTLVGILAADMSLHAGTYRASEQTFQLLTQAAGRAGRGEKSGDVIIQTYSPEHYSIQCASEQNYEKFYNKEILFRKMLRYPPVGFMMAVLVTSTEETMAKDAIDVYANMVVQYGTLVEIIGPTDAPVSKIKDRYRKLLYVKSSEQQILIEIKDQIELLYEELHAKKCYIQFDL